MTALSADYDERADMLYLSLGEPRPAVGEVDDKGLILRFALDDAAHCGVTVPWFRDWSDDWEELTRRCAEFLSVPESDVLAALPPVC